MIFVGLNAKNQLILVKTIDFKPLVPQKSSVESSMNDDVYQKKVSKVLWCRIRVHLFWWLCFGDFDFLRGHKKILPTENTE